MADDFYYEWTHKIAEVWRETISNSGESGTSKTEATASALERLRQMVDDGDLKIPVDTAITSALVDADRKDHRSADKVLTRMRHGEDLLDLEIENGMDVVVALGQGKRKTLGNVTSADLLAMDALRAKNVKDATDAFDTWRNDVFTPYFTALMKHRTIAVAVASGDLG